MAAPHYKLWFNGEWVDSKANKKLEVLSPIDDSVVGTVENGNEEDAKIALKHAEEAFKTWKNVPARKRAELVRAFANEIRANRETLAKITTQEQGKLYKVALFEADVCASFMDYAADWARQIEGDIIPSDNENEQIWIQKIPRGVVVGITAWNFPVALAGRKMGPALVAGNTMVLKPTSETPIATLLLGELAKKAGIPDGVLNVITGPGRTMGGALCGSPITKMVTMTGSTPAGQTIFKTASENLAHVQLELGGKAPFIVFPDCDLDNAVDSALHSRFDNCGQVCTCNERMYLHEDIYEPFMEKFMAKVRALKVGNPFNADADIGPKVNKAELKHMHELVAKSIEEGAKVECGGGVPAGEEFQKGNWFEPTILTNVTQKMTIVHEETFGPILPVLKFKGFDEVVAMANDCEYGLAAMVHTNDMNKIMRLNQELEFGEIYVNRGHGELHQGFHNGYKMSGSGGEDGKYGFEQYLEKKTFYMRFNPTKGC